MIELPGNAALPCRKLSLSGTACPVLSRRGPTPTRKSSRDVLSPRLVGIQSAPRTAGVNVPAAPGQSKPYFGIWKNDRFRNGSEGGDRAHYGDRDDTFAGHF